VRLLQSLQIHLAGLLSLEAMMSILEGSCLINNTVVMHTDVQSTSDEITDMHTLLGNYRHVTEEVI
jgi:hypothetical protein